MQRFAVMVLATGLALCGAAFPPAIAAGRPALRLRAAGAVPKLGEADGAPSPFAPKQEEDKQPKNPK